MKAQPIGQRQPDAAGSAQVYFRNRPADWNGRAPNRQRVSPPALGLGVAPRIAARRCGRLAGLSPQTLAGVVERKPFGPLPPFENVAMRAAAKAVIKSLRIVDGKARALLLVKRAEAPEVRPTLGELDAPCDMAVSRRRALSAPRSSCERMSLFAASPVDQIRVG